MIRVVRHPEMGSETAPVTDTDVDAFRLSCRTTFQTWWPQQMRSPYLLRCRRQFEAYASQKNSYVFTISNVPWSSTRSIVANISGHSRLPSDGTTSSDVRLYIKIRFDIFHLERSLFLYLIREKVYAVILTALPGLWMPKASTYKPIYVYNNDSISFTISTDRIEIGAEVPITEDHIEVYIHELYFVYWSKTWERSHLDIIILADKIGLGKRGSALRYGKMDSHSGCRYSRRSRIQAWYLFTCVNRHLSEISQRNMPFQ